MSPCTFIERCRTEGTTAAATDLLINTFADGFLAAKELDHVGAGYHTTSAALRVQAVYEMLTRSAEARHEEWLLKEELGEYGLLANDPTRDPDTGLPYHVLRGSQPDL